jgi:hypothetical protein
MSFFDRIHELPLRALGLEDIPAVPVDLVGMVETLVRLGTRAQETAQAMQGLTTPYTIGGVTALGHDFLFGGVAADAPVAAARERLREHLSRDPLRAAEAFLEAVLRNPAGVQDGGPASGGDAAPAGSPGRAPAGGALTALSLDRPEQWSISWTSLPDVRGLGAPLLAGFAATLTDAERATAAFWPTIAEYGLAYNLLLPKKLAGDDLEGLRAVFGEALPRSAAAAAAAGRLYAIDLRLFETLAPREIDGALRFTPATYTLLEQDDDKVLLPTAIRVTGSGGDGAQVFVRGTATDAAWLYALQAAKTSVTVWGIWLGHVYHWHVVTAALMMTLLRTLPAVHPISQLLRPQSSYLIPFDDVLLVLWNEIAPPTSVTSGLQFLELANTFARGRQLFDDDPTTTLRRLGIEQGDFSVAGPWDRYPIAGRLLRIWEACSGYVQAFVETSYSDDQQVAQDAALQTWIRASGDPSGGNLRGLPAMTSRAALAAVLTSIVYRLTAHGASRLYRSANPALTFVANYPPCLQDGNIPEPSSTFDTETLLRFLPRTGTIGKMVRFYFTFSFSVPYVPFIPIAGPTTGLFFGDDPAEPRNAALIRLRREIASLIEELQPETPQLFQWPLNIET